MMQQRHSKKKSALGALFLIGAFGPQLGSVQR